MDSNGTAHSTVSFQSTGDGGYTIELNATEADGTTSQLERTKMGNTISTSYRTVGRRYQYGVQSAGNLLSLTLDGSRLITLNGIATAQVSSPQSVSYSGNTITVSNGGSSFQNVGTFYYYDGLRYYQFTGSAVNQLPGPGKLYVNEGVGLYSISSALNSQLDSIIESISGNTESGGSPVAPIPSPVQPTPSPSTGSSSSQTDAPLVFTTSLPRPRPSAVPERTPGPLPGPTPGSTDEDEQSSSSRDSMSSPRRHRPPAGTPRPKEDKSPKTTDDHSPHRPRPPSTRPDQRRPESTDRSSNSKSKPRGHRPPGRPSPEDGRRPRPGNSSPAHVSPPGRESSRQDDATKGSPTPPRPHPQDDQESSPSSESSQSSSRAEGSKKKHRSSTSDHESDSSPRRHGRLVAGRHRTSKGSESSNSKGHSLRHNGESSSGPLVIASMPTTTELPLEVTETNAKFGLRMYDGKVFLTYNGKELVELTHAVVQDISRFQLAVFQNNSILVIEGSAIVAQYDNIEQLFVFNGTAVVQYSQPELLDIVGGKLFMSGKVGFYSTSSELSEKLTEASPKEVFALEFMSRPEGELLLIDNVGITIISDSQVRDLSSTQHLSYFNETLSIVESDGLNEGRIVEQFTEISQLAAVDRVLPGLVVYTNSSSSLDFPGGGRLYVNPPTAFYSRDNNVNEAIDEYLNAEDTSVAFTFMFQRIGGESFVKLLADGVEIITLTGANIVATDPESILLYQNNNIILQEDLPSITLGINELVFFDGSTLQSFRGSAPLEIVGGGELFMRGDRAFYSTDPELNSRIADALASGVTATPTNSPSSTASITPSTSSLSPSLPQASVLPTPDEVPVSPVCPPTASEGPLGHVPCSTPAPGSTRGYTRRPSSPRHRMPKPHSSQAPPPEHETSGSKGRPSRTEHSRVSGPVPESRKGGDHYHSKSPRGHSHKRAHSPFH